ncbi:sugar ABC transporter permease [Bacillus sp. AFS076308]|uniref:carbohydrate ABC transporter permease n=1 Tax=unclassified Bacillus (in: firmicutes) TaxID=185979 RepID=UPI000BF4B742|nr:MULTISPECIES: carbohydrate ABC transporter permease [unclassified Bacillus (in: firmicutes)]PFO07128.1 sugar ABC transporter permease [Bacillus sp. AFS076308]PGV55431.1 sugar ABC transporter permease [Bacillus sp. AFS037270]
MQANVAIKETTLNYKNKRKVETINLTISYIILIILALVFIFPFLWMISTAFKVPSEAYTIPPKLIPKTFTLDNFIQGWQYADFTRYTWNTIIVTVLATLGAVFSASLVAYGFARFKSRYSNILFAIVLGTMMLPNQVLLIPTYILFSKLGWLDTLKPLIVPSFFGGGAFNIFLLRQFFKTIPAELDQAAKIDGANTFQIYYKILLPIIKPALMSVAVMSVAFHWNDFMTPLIYLNSDKHFTLALGLQFFQNSYGSSQVQMLMAVSLITVIPLLILFFIGQRYFVQGITMSGLKG